MGYCDLCCRIWQFKLLNLITCIYLNYSCNKNEKSTQANRTIYCSLPFMAKNSHNYAKAFISRIHIFCKKNNLLSNKLYFTRYLSLKIQLQLYKGFDHFTVQLYSLGSPEDLGTWELVLGIFIYLFPIWFVPHHGHAGSPILY